MRKHELIILKIGGSVITEKSEELKVRMGNISRLAKEIKDANIENLIVIHGGGSFGHPIAQRHGIKEGFKEEAQKIGFSETHHVMTVLNGLFMDSLVWHGIPAVTITPSSCIITKNGIIHTFERGPLERLLELCFIPVLYGDAVLDSELGFTILSGDQLVSALSKEFGADRIIMGVDVDGLYEEDPKLNKSAKRFTHLTLKELRNLQAKLGKESVSDVTGGMFGKTQELLPAIERGVPVTIVNATEPDRIYKTLKKKKVKSTLIRKEFHVG
ncbi:amino acid kinase [Candidatus Bathyarchaeota archaeon]|nr:amino acid kinase [Candidatus Bathyarchaeota archaeon]